MKRITLLFFTVLAVAVVAPAQAHEGPHAETGAVLSVSADSITVDAAKDLTCAVVAGRSPSVAGLRAGDMVAVECNWLEGRQVLTGLVRHYAGKITAMSRSLIAVRSARGTIKCVVPRSKANMLRGMKVGHKVTVGCARIGQRLIFVGFVGGHAGH